MSEALAINPISISAPTSPVRSGVVNSGPILLDDGHFLARRDQQAIKNRYKEFLEPLKVEPDKIIMPRRLVSNTLIELDYSAVVPRGHRRSGRQLFEYARRQDSQYSEFVREEDTLIVRVSSSRFAALSHLHLPYLSFGPGTDSAVDVRDEEIRRLLQSKEYYALDIERLIAKNAAKTIKDAMKRARQEVTVGAFDGDFTKKWPQELLDLIKGKPLFASLVGGTAGQFDMHKFLQHFYEMTEGMGILYYTLNCNRTNPQMTYSGTEFIEFKGYTWDLLKTVSGDENFAPEVISYQGLPQNGRIEHRYTVNWETQVIIDGDTFLLPQNTVLITGGSSRPAPAALLEEAVGTGMMMQQADHNLNTYGFFAVGDRFPDYVELFSPNPSAFFPMSPYASEVEAPLLSTENRLAVGHRRFDANSLGS